MTESERGWKVSDPLQPGTKWVNSNNGNLYVWDGKNWSKKGNHWPIPGDRFENCYVSPDPPPETPPGTLIPTDLNTKPSMSPDAVFCGLICAIFVICFSAMVLVFARSCS
jgi:hypothetical protein